MSRILAFAMIFGAASFATPFQVHCQEQKQVKMSSDELAKWLEQRFGSIWKQEGITPAPLANDATLLRRVYLDLVGTIPSVSKTRDFLEDSAAYKRARLVEAVFSKEPTAFTDHRTAERSAEHLARVWRRVMVPGNSPNTRMAVQLEPWLKEQFASNVPYDQFTRSLLTATPPQNTGGPIRAVANGPAAFQQAVGNTPDNLADAFSRVFLGVRIGCAKCHDHPFTSWKQEDFWGMAAFFSQDGAKITAMDSGMEYSAKFLGDKDAKIPDQKAAREALADWMVAADNANFAATAVNRVWQHLCGRGIVGEVDDLDRVSNEERSLILNDLSKKFVDANFDLRWLIEGICKSTIYQRECAPGKAKEETRLAAYRPLKTLTPEQVFDSLEQALSLPVSNNQNSPRYNGQRIQLVARLNEAFAASPDQFRAGIPQALMIMHGKLTADATDLDKSRTLRAVVDAPFLRPTAKIETLYLATLTRRPRPIEIEHFTKYVDSQPTKDSRRQAYAEIFWGLLNSPEFVLSR